MTATSPSRITLYEPSTGIDLALFKIGLIDDLLEDQGMPARRRADLRRRRRHLYDEISRCMDNERKMRMADQLVSDSDKLKDIDRRTKRILRDWWLFDIVHFKLPHLAPVLAVMAAVVIAVCG